jgi:hypothetical protein
MKVPRKAVDLSSNGWTEVALVAPKLELVDWGIKVAGIRFRYF